MSQRAKHLYDSVPCVLQEQDAERDIPRVEAQEVMRDGQQRLEIVSYSVPHDPETDDEEDMDITDAICLTPQGWEALVQMFAYRYPEVAARIVTRAQGWQENQETERP